MVYSPTYNTSQMIHEKYIKETDKPRVDTHAHMETEQVQKPYVYVWGTSGVWGYRSGLFSPHDGDSIYRKPTHTAHLHDEHAVRN